MSMAAFGNIRTMCRVEGVASQHYVQRLLDKDPSNMFSFSMISVTGLVQAPSFTTTDTLSTFYIRMQCA